MVSCRFSRQKPSIECRLSVWHWWAPPEDHCGAPQPAPALAALAAKQQASQNWVILPNLGIRTYHKLYLNRFIGHLMVFGMVRWPWWFRSDFWDASMMVLRKCWSRLIKSLLQQMKWSSKNPKKTVSVDCWIALPASCRKLWSFHHLSHPPKYRDPDDIVQICAHPKIGKEQDHPRLHQLVVPKDPHFRFSLRDIAQNLCHG